MNSIPHMVPNMSIPIIIIPMVKKTNINIFKQV